MLTSNHTMLMFWTQRLAEQFHSGYGSRLWCFLTKCLALHFYWGVLASSFPTESLKKIAHGNLLMNIVAEG
jgi:hypothetical protein